MCVTYRNRSLGTLDCTLLQWTLTITLAAVEEQIALLENTTATLQKLPPGTANEWIGQQITQLNDFASQCSSALCSSLSSLLTDLGPASNTAQYRRSLQDTRRSTASPSLHLGISKLVV